MPRGHQSMLSQSNMSDIKQSIEEYSMNFENSQNQQCISEAISVSKTGNNVSMPRPSKKIQKNNLIKIIDKEVQKSQFKKTEQSIIQEVADKQNASNFNQSKHNDHNDPINLGDQVFKIIAERYRQVQGNQTYDSDVLFDFFKRQRKNYKPSKSIVKNVTTHDIGTLMPSSQRKMLLKLQFEKILTYYPHDVFFTLACGAQKYKKDIQLQSKANKLNFYLDQRPQSKKKNLNQVIQRLYPLKTSPQKGKPMQIQSYQKRNLFGTRLLEHFINHFRTNPDPPQPSAQKLYQFWEDTYQREQYGIEWSQSTAKDDIKLFMMDQVQNLLTFLQRKLGFKALNQVELKKFYLQYAPIANITIPPKYFKNFVNAFNDIMKENETKKQEQQKKYFEKKQETKKQRDLKRFGRPVSATPLSVLSKPKTATNFNDLSAYANDKILSTILLTDKSKMARRPFEYGIYDMQDQIKTKGRIKPKQKQNFDQTIFKQLTKTFTNTNFFNPHKLGRVIDILGEQQIEKEKNWKQLGPILQQAMLVQCYQEVQFRNSLAKYCHKVLNKDFKFSDDKVIAQELMKFLDGLDQQKRGDQISILQKTLKMTQDKVIRQKKKLQIGQKSANSEIANRNLFYSFLTEKACKFVEMRVKRQEVNLRQFMNDIFKTVMKEEKYQQFVKKHFHTVEGQKQCPKLLKYQFFRIQKDINPLTLEKDQKTKCHAWIPTKNDPENFNYKTFNTYSNAYRVDKGKFMTEQQRDNHKRSLWGYKKDKAKLRENLMMTFEDAKQCVFHPKITKQL